MLGQMQVRLDPDIARLVRRDAAAHKRLFKRRRSHAAIVNEALRDLFKNASNHNPVV